MNFRDVMNFKSTSLFVLTVFGMRIVNNVGDTVCTESFVFTWWLSIKTIILMVIIWTLGLVTGDEQ